MSDHAAVAVNRKKRGDAKPPVVASEELPPPTTAPALERPLILRDHRGKVWLARILLFFFFAGLCVANYFVSTYMVRAAFWLVGGQSDLSCCVEMGMRIQGYVALVERIGEFQEVVDRFVERILPEPLHG